MACRWCLAGIDDVAVPIFSAALQSTGERALAIHARLNVAELGRLAPDLLVCDVDDIQVDELEFLRQVRFVLPDCLIAVYTANTTQRWSRACHLAGVNCVLAKGSDRRLLSAGLSKALSTGCYTDPSFAV